MTDFKAVVDGESFDWRFVDDEGIRWWVERLRKYPQIQIAEIGRSREGRPLYGFSIGDRADSVTTITAGAHADEPAGPIAALVLLEALARGLEVNGDRLTEVRKFMVCPQVNPDGAQANREWFAAVPDLETYLRHVKREGPGDDIEFGYPGRGKGALRPENQAVVDFFMSEEPAFNHLSLHSMAFASGAWYLLSSEIANEQEAWEALAAVAKSHGFDLHDMQRNGDKGFRRLAPGFCTTPESQAMIEHFERLGDLETAAKFHLNSMEWTEERDPLAICLVTEMPMFALENGYDEQRRQNRDIAADIPSWRVPRPGCSALERFREELKPLVGAGDFAGALKVAERYGVCPVPFRAQVEVMVDSVVAFFDAEARVRIRRTDEDGLQDGF